jgi:hypothetical protein
MPRNNPEPVTPLRPYLIDHGLAGLEQEQLH